MKETFSRNHIGTLATIALLFPLAAASDSQAGTVGLITPPTVTISADGFNGPAWEFSPALDALEMASGRGRGLKLGVERAFEQILGNRADVVVKELEFDPDPFVLNNILITNPTAITQIYTVGIALPTTFPAPNFISGSVLTGVIEGGNDVATVASVAGFPIYTAQIDFASVATLQEDPFAISTVLGNPVNSASESFGPELNLIPVASHIGIQLRFSLTAGDTASILSRFDVVGVPEPASWCLGTIGMLAVIAIGRRRFG